jgi:hypothetical protein
MIEKLRKKKRESFVAVDLKEKWERDGITPRKKPLYDSKKIIFKKTSCRGEKRLSNPYKKTTDGISKSIKLNEADSSQDLKSYKRDVFCDVLFNKKLKEEL